MFFVNNVAPFVALIAAVAALVYACFQFYSVKKKPEGTEQMKNISAKIRMGAMAYLKRQYKVVAIFFAVMFVVLATMAAFEMLTWYVAFAFVTGGFFSALSGYIGMKIATAANTRTANACQPGLNRGLRVAFSAYGRKCAA